jgi:iron complex outermembrane receptor protein
LAAVTPNLTVGFNVGVVESEYKDLELSGIDLSGNDFTNTPDLTANINADWRVASVADGDIHLRADVSYIGDQWFSPFNDKPSNATDPVGNGNLQQEGYWLSNARVSWEHENVQLAVWGRNLADEEYFTYGLDLRAFTGADWMIRGARRSFGVEASYYF